MPLDTYPRGSYTTRSRATMCVCMSECGCIGARVGDSTRDRQAHIYQGGCATVYRPIGSKHSLSSRVSWTHASRTRRGLGPPSFECSPLFPVVAFSALAGPSTRTDTRIHRAHTHTGRGTHRHVNVSKVRSLLPLVRAPRPAYPPILPVQHNRSHLTRDVTDDIETGRKRWRKRPKRTRSTLFCNFVIP